MKRGSISRSELVAQLYEHILLDDVLPFWFPSCVDKRLEAFSCLDQGGKVYETDKSVWAQGRMTGCCCANIWIAIRILNGSTGLSWHRVFGSARV